MKRRHASNEASTAGLHAYATPRTVHSKALEQWRDAFTFKQAQEACTFQNSKFTFAALQSGGLVDTLSAIRAGFSPIWGSEICPQHTQSPLQCSEIHRSRYCRENNNRDCGNFSLKQSHWAILSVDYTNTQRSRGQSFWVPVQSVSTSAPVAAKKEVVALLDR